MYFRIELTYNCADEPEASSIFLTSDGGVILQGQKVSEADRQSLSLPSDAILISIDRRLIRMIKDML